MNDNDKNREQNLDCFELSEDGNANSDIDNEDDDDDFGFRLDDDDDQEFDLSWIDNDEEAEEVLGPPKPNIPKKRLIEGLTLEWADFENRTFSSFQLSHFSLYNVTFKNCTLDNIDCQSGRFIACKFEDCNIISFSGEGYGFRECEFIRCKWSGNECIDDCYYYSNCKYTDCEENYD